MGSSRSAGVAFSPDSDVSQGRHHFLLRVSGSNLDSVDIHCYATVARSGKGDAIFKVTDMYTGTKNDDGQLVQGVNGAEVELQNEKVKDIRREADTDGLGEAAFSDLPAGRYRYRVSASNHETQTGRVWIKPGVTAAKEVFLPTSMVTVHWDVEETTIEDEYEIVLTAEYETDVPAPVVVMEPASTSIPSLEAGEVFQGEINLINKGKIRAENVSAQLPSGGEHFRFEMLGEVPDTLAAGERVSLPYKVTCQQPLEQSGGSGGGDCGSYMRCMTVDYEWVCANGEWSKQAVKHCWTAVYGDCSGSGGGAPPIHPGGSGGASWGGGTGGGGSSSTVPEPGDLEGAECIPEPPSGPGPDAGGGGDGGSAKAGAGCSGEDPCKETENGRCCETGSGVDLLQGDYQLPGNVDLAVKAPGGRVRLRRDYYQGQWHFRHAFTLEPPQGSEDRTVVRAGATYRAQNSGSDTYTNNHHRIEPVQDGWRWENDDGDWEKYDEQGRLTAYGNRKGVLARVVYPDANATLAEGINDRHGNRLLSFEYGADDTLDRAYTPNGRQARYIHEQDRLSRVVGPLGKETLYEYNDKGRISRAEYPQGKVRKIEYSSFGDQYRVSRVIDSRGRATSFDYSYDEASGEYYAMAEFPSGKVKEVWFDPEGDVRRIDINGETIRTIEKDGRDLLITDERGLTTRKEYDEWNNLTRIEYPDGSTVTYEYDHELDRVTRKVNERGVVTEYDYDSQGNRIRKIEAAGTPSERVTEYSYDGDGNRIEIVRPGGAVVSMEYDERGNMIRRTGPEGGVTTFTYDEAGNVLKKEAPEGRTWEYEYDARGRRTKKVDPKGRVTEYAYDSLGNKVKEIAPGDRVTRFEYDAEGNLVKRIREGDPETDSDDLVTRFEYNAAGKVTRKVGPGGKEVRFEYDKRGRKKRTIKAGNEIVRHYGSGVSGCSSCGGPSNKPSRIEYPTYSVEYAYDKRGRKTLEKKFVNGSTLTTQYEYDASGNLVSQTDPKGRTTEKSYDPLGRVSQKTDPAGGVTEYEYDARGNLIRLTDPKGQTTRFEYDLRDQLVKKIRPMGETTTYSYDKAGNLVEKIASEGQRTVYEYNLADELVAVKYYASTGSSSPEKTVSFSYNEAGHLLSYDDGTTSGSYSYDAFGRRTNSTVDYGPFQLNHGTSYTESSRKKSLTYPDGSTYEYSYNDANRIQSMDLPDSGQITWGEYEWRRPTKVHLPGGASKSFNLDPLQRIKKITSRDPAGNTVLHREYDYDKAGNIVSEKTGNGRHDYGYDPLDRLTQAENPVLSDEDYSYDAVGNRLTSADTNGTWSYNSNNELLAYNNATCSFDDNGNMVKRVVDGEVTRYIYNANNRLIRVEDGSGDVIAKYYYDPFGRRLWKEVKGERIYFHYSEQGLIAEYDGQGDPIRFYGYKPGSSWTTDPQFLKKDGDYYFYHNDHLGTPQKLTASNGRVVWSARYASFGGTQLVEQEIKNPLRFPGQYYDQEIGLHYNYHRYYDPQVGRYLKEDLIGLEGGINPYLYANANSLRLVDPKGLDAWSGAGVEASGFVFIYGRSKMVATITNWKTGETCRLKITCNKLGIGMGVGVTANSIWLPNGPECGKDLKGTSAGFGVEGGLGYYLSSSPGGSAAVNSKGNVTLNFGGGFGYGGSMHASRCKTNIMSCDDTPQKCKCH